MDNIYKTRVIGHPEMDKLKLIAEWLYLNELDEIHGDFKPKRLKSFRGLPAPRRWKLLNDALDMWNNYSFVKLVLERSSTPYVSKTDHKSTCSWLKPHASSCNCGAFRRARKRNGR